MADENAGGRRALGHRKLNSLASQPLTANDSTLNTSNQPATKRARSNTVPAPPPPQSCHTVVAVVTYTQLDRFFTVSICFLPHFCSLE